MKSLMKSFVACAALVCGVAVNVLAAGDGPLPYVETMGAQYFDTFRSVGPNTRIVLEFSCTCTQLGSQHIYGFGAQGSGRSSFLTRNVTVDGGQTNETFTVCHGDTWSGANMRSKTFVGVTTDIHTIEITKEAITLDGEVLDGGPTTMTGSTPSVALGAAKAGWMTGNMPVFGQAMGGWCRIYRCSFYEGDVQVADFTPVRCQGRPALRDLVTDNVVFSQNSEAVGEAPDFVPPEMAADPSLKGYVLANGSQAFDTGCKGGPQTTVKLTFSLADQSEGSSGCIFGYGASGSQQSLHVLYSVANGKETYQVVCSDRYQDYDSVTVDSVPRQVHTLEISADGKTFDGQPMTGSTGIKLTKTTTGTMYLFAMNQQWSTAAGQQAKVRLYDCQIAEGGNLVRHYRPVCDMESLKFCLYEAVSGTLVGQNLNLAGAPVGYRPKLWRHRFVEFTGANFFRTAIIPSPDLRVTMRYGFTSVEPKTPGNNVTESIFGHWGVDGGPSVYARRSVANGQEHLVAVQNDGSVSGFSSRDVDVNTSVHTLDMGPSGFYLDGVRFGDNQMTKRVTTREANMGAYMCIGSEEHAWDKTETAKSGARLRLYSMQVYQRGRPIADYEPSSVAVAGSETRKAVLFNRIDSTLISDPGAAGSSQNPIQLGPRVIGTVIEIR